MEINKQMTTISISRLFGIALIAGGSIVGIIMMVLMSNYADAGNFTSATATIATIAAFIFNKLLFHWMFIPLKLPYKRLLGDDGSVLFDHVKFEFLAPQEGFMLSLKVCFFGGLILALPLHSFFLPQFAGMLDPILIPSC